MSRRIALRTSEGRIRAYALVDDADYDALAAYRWHVHSEHYAARWDWSSGRRRIVLMHRAITRAPPGLEVDHINGRGRDNRRQNLRVVTHRQNAQNQRVPRNSLSGRRGVSRNRRGTGWLVRVEIVVATRKEAERLNREIRSNYMPFSKEATRAAGI